MSGPPPQTDDSTDGTDQSRYASLGLLDDVVVIYDRRNNRAWIQSDGAVAQDAMA